MSNTEVRELVLGLLYYYRRLPEYTDMMRPIEEKKLVDSYVELLDGLINGKSETPEERKKRLSDHWEEL